MPAWLCSPVLLGKGTASNPLKREQREKPPQVVAEAAALSHLSVSLMYSSIPQPPSWVGNPTQKNDC